MNRLACPWCGERDLAEFAYAGEAGVRRPGPLEGDTAVSDADWAGFVFGRRNRRGVDDEQWRHEFGCRQIFFVRRCALTHRVEAVWRRGEPAP